MLAYRQTELEDFLHLSTYELIKSEPKWRLDTRQLTETVNQQTRATDQTVRERIDKEKLDEPTVVGTGKPEGVKKARRTIVELSVKEKEIEKEQAALTSYLDSLTQKSQLGIRAIEEGSKRTRAMQEAVDDELMGKDTSGMYVATRGYWELRKKRVLQLIVALDVQKELDKLAATVEAAQASVAEEAAVASAEETVQFEDAAGALEDEGWEEEDDEVEGYNGSEEEFDARVRSEE